MGCHGRNDASALLVGLLIFKSTADYSVIRCTLITAQPLSRNGANLYPSPCCAHDTASSYMPHAASCSFSPFAHLSSRQHGLYPVLFYADRHFQLNPCLYQQYLHLRRRKNHDANKQQWQLRQKCTTFSITLQRIHLLSHFLVTGRRRRQWKSTDAGQQQTSKAALNRLIGL